MKLLTTEKKDKKNPLDDVLEDMEKFEDELEHKHTRQEHKCC